MIAKSGEMALRYPKYLSNCQIVQQKLTSIAIFTHFIYVLHVKKLQDNNIVNNISFRLDMISNFINFKIVPQPILLVA
jgi:hypothetical protein